MNRRERWAELCLETKPICLPEGFYFEVGSATGHSSKTALQPSGSFGLGSLKGEETAVTPSLRVRNSGEAQGERKCPM